MDGKKRSRAVSLVLAGLFAMNQGDLVAADRSKEGGQAQKRQTEPSKAVMSYRKVTETDGREFWLIRFDNATYRIPDEYVANVPSSGVSIRMHWPTGRGPRVAHSLGVAWDPLDVVGIFLSPPGEVPIVARDSYDSYEAFNSFLARYERRPSGQYAGLIEYYSVNKKTGDSTVHYYVSAEGTIRTPSGNPYMCEVLFSRSPHARCDTFIRLPERSQLRVEFRIKHLADWQRIYPAVVNLIESSRRN